MAALAARQHGVVSGSQLLEMGFGRGAIRNDVADGRLHRVHAGVYAVGHAAVGGQGRLIAAVLACGPAAVLSHRSAGGIWELRQGSQTAVDVTVPGRTRHRRPGITLHRVRALHPDDHTTRQGIPTTTVARTLLDLAEVLNPRQLERTLEQAERQRLLDITAIEQLMSRSPGRHGLKPLKTLLLNAAVDLAPETRSTLERAFLDLCKAHHLPRPQINVAFAGYEVDALWPDHRLVVELDGRAFHSTRAAFERDRVRDADLQLAGYRVIRVTYRRFTTDSAGVARTLRALMDTPRPPVHNPVHAGV
jgi:very-short-patch-repair endonuclease